MTISIGTASSMPQTFQTHPQNSRPTNTATAFIRAARLVSHGVSRNPSRLVIASATPDDEQRHADAAELQERDDGGAASDDDRAEVGDRVEHAGQNAPHRRLLQSEPAERQPRRQRRRPRS